MARKAELCIKVGSQAGAWEPEKKVRGAPSRNLAGFTGGPKGQEQLLKVGCASLSRPTAYGSKDSRGRGQAERPPQTETARRLIDAPVMLIRSDYFCNAVIGKLGAKTKSSTDAVAQIF